MEPTPARKSRNPIAIALWANALVLAGILIAILSRGGTVRAEQAPIAGGGGVFIMPGQLSFNNWGCYMLDIDRQTLCVYRYFPGQQALRLEASRNYRWDLQLKNLNTFPEPAQVQALVQAQLNARGNAPPQQLNLVPPETGNVTPGTNPSNALPPTTLPEGPIDGRAVDAPRE